MDGESNGQRPGNDTATLCQCIAFALDPGRQAMWKRIRPPDGHLPVRSPLPQEASVLGEKVPVYFVDLARLTPEQFDRMVSETVSKFGGDRRQTAEAIRQYGMPVKAVDVLVRWCPLHTRCVR